MLPVSINLFTKTFHAYQILNFETTKLETLVDTDLRNVFCSLGYFKTWSLRWSLCRQTSEQASLDRLRYSLAHEMVYLRPYFVNQASMNVYRFDIHGFKPSHKLTIKFGFITTQ